MKKFAVILASLTFFAGCARNDTQDLTEDTTTTPDTGLGTAASGESGMDRDSWSTTTSDQNTMGTTNDFENRQMETTSPGANQPGNSQPGLNDENIQIIETNELNRPSGAGEGSQPTGASGQGIQ